MGGDEGRLCDVCGPPDPAAGRERQGVARAVETVRRAATLPSGACARAGADQQLPLVDQGRDAAADCSCGSETGAGTRSSKSKLAAASWYNLVRRVPLVSLPPSGEHTFAVKHLSEERTRCRSLLHACAESLVDFLTGGSFMSGAHRL